jgi:hypothetical protein
MSDSYKGNGATTPGSLDSIDIGVFAVIAAFGALQVILYQRAGDFLFDDVFYFEAARSLLQHGFYGFNGRPETNQPPGLPAILALLCLARACTHGAFLRAMAVFETLGLGASYVLLRRQIPRAVAAATCLLLISSPLFFALGTQSVATTFPLLLTSSIAFLVAQNLEESERLTARLLWGILLVLLVSASLMIASASIALLGAITMVMGVALFRDQRLAVRRLKAFGAVLLVGIAVQGFWMHRKPAPLEWPLPGYPRPYLEQLKVKYGNDPELGMAKLSDIPIRVGENLFDESVLQAQLLYPRWINPYWASVLILGPLLLVVIGCGSCILETGGSLQDWYFVGYQFIYLLWPWKINVRYFLPIAPLACLYLWYGIRRLGWLMENEPRELGAIWFPFGVFLTASAWLWERGAWFGRNALIHGGLQDDLSVVLWLASAIFAGRMVWTGRSIRGPIDWASHGFGRVAGVLRCRPQRLAQVSLVAALVVLMATGLAAELDIGNTNLHFSSNANRIPPDVEAGLWIHSHTDPNAIVMAVQVPTVYYYAQRRVVWFPPSSNPQLLMEGIERHHVDYVVVAERVSPFYLPSDDDCFAPLQRAYPDAFLPVLQTNKFRIFQVLPKAPYTRPATRS